jgi:transposase-like protein
MEDEVSGVRRRHSGEFKARVALEAIKGQRTVNEIAAVYGVHPVQVTQWKKQAVEELPQALADRRSREARSIEEERARLFQEIGQLKVELDWLKKRTGLTT